MHLSDHIEDMAKEAAGNWRKFESFAWHDKPKHPDLWCIVYTHNRDSGLVDQSNASVIAKALAPYEGRTVRTESHSHWAVGHVDGFAIKVYTNKGQITKAFKVWAELQLALQNYPLLDESDHSHREYTAAVSAIVLEGERYTKEGKPEDWAEQVYSWLSDNDSLELESRDDQGPYPSRESVKAALDALGFAESE